MTTYIDTENCDMRQLAFEQIKGIDLPVWKDVTCPEEIEVKRISGRKDLVCDCYLLGAMTNIIFKLNVVGKECQSLLLRAYGSGKEYVSRP